MRFLVPALGLVLFTSACTLNTDYFSEYRGVNLLGNYDFNALKTDGVTPKWALATSTDFMTWQAVPTDPQRPTEAYRLEIKNLIPNGDFEDAAVTPDATGVTSLPPGWQTFFFNGTPPSAAAVVNFGTTPSNTIHNGTINGTRAMGWDAQGTGNQIRYAISAMVTPTAWRISPLTYLFRVDMINVGTGASVGMTLYENTTNGVPQDTLYNGQDWTVNTIKADNSTDNTSVYAVVAPFILKSVTDVRTVAFGPNSTTGTNAAVIDNVRLLPGNEPLAVSASFPNLSSGTKPLLPGSKEGMYVFTIDVKDDPNAGAGNHFRPKSFSVLFEASVKSGSRNRLITVPAPTSGWPAWTTLSFKLGFDFVNTDADLAGQPALKVSLSPTVSSTGDSDVGTILVSRPTLTFNP